MCNVTQPRMIICICILLKIKSKHRHMFGDKKTVKFASVLLRPEIRNVNKAKNVPLFFHAVLLISFKMVY